MRKVIYVLIGIVVLAALGAYIGLPCYENIQHTRACARNAMLASSTIKLEAKAMQTKIQPFVAGDRPPKHRFAANDRLTPTSEDDFRRLIAPANMIIATNSADAESIASSYHGLGTEKNLAPYGEKLQRILDSYSDHLCGGTVTVTVPVKYVVSYFRSSDRLINLRVTTDSTSMGEKLTTATSQLIADCDAFQAKLPLSAEEKAHLQHLAEETQPRYR